MQAGFLSWIVYSLARNPRVWDILRREILTDFGRVTPTYQQLKDTKYLKWVLNEGT
jgi:cytochrome P450